MFWAFQPIVLKANEIPTAVSPVVVTLLVVASITEVLLDDTNTSPVVVTSLLVIHARAWPKTRFVAITPLTASD